MTVAQSPREKEIEKYSGTCSQMTASCKSPIECRTPKTKLITYQQTNFDILKFSIKQ